MTNHITIIRLNIVRFILHEELIHDSEVKYKNRGDSDSECFDAIIYIVFAEVFNKFYTQKIL